MAWTLRPDDTGWTIEDDNGEPLARGMSLDIAEQLSEFADQESVEDRIDSARASGEEIGWERGYAEALTDLLCALDMDGARIIGDAAPVMALDEAVEALRPRLKAIRARARK